MLLFWREIHPGAFRSLVADHSDRHFSYRGLVEVSWAIIFIYETNYHLIKKNQASCIRSTNLTWIMPPGRVFGPYLHPLKWSPCYSQILIQLSNHPSQDAAVWPATVPHTLAIVRTTKPFYDHNPDQLLDPLRNSYRYATIANSKAF